MADVFAVGGGSLLLGLCVLACPLMMGAMMWGMRRASRRQQPPDAPMADPSNRAELAHLRAEMDQLKAAQADTTERPAGQPAPLHRPLGAGNILP